ncbi:MAG: hypothetical protein QOE55_2787, partial [Acidobacteriaceae bacterium]|nr:hypothetical protein [Acidobacteriaceae bacterium]
VKDLNQAKTTCKRNQKEDGKRRQGQERCKKHLRCEEDQEDGEVNRADD